jgi:hypothetical protein
MRKATYQVILWGLVAIASIASAGAALTRFEAEVVNTPATTSDSLGFDKQGGFWIDFSEAGNSNGKVIYTATSGASAKFLFVGTGVDLIIRKAGNGGPFTWSLDNGAATGSGDCFGDLTQQFSIPIASGLPNTMHTLEITAALSTVGTIVLLDAFDVHDSTPRNRVNDDDLVNISYSSVWAHGDTGFGAPTEAPGGSVTYTTAVGESFSYTFTGTAVALIVVPRQDSFAFNWSIDSGAYTGTVDPQPVAGSGHVAGGIWYRYPFILRNDLPDAPHTLTVTIANAAAGANFIALFDAIDYGSFALTPVELSAFAAE